MLCTLVLASAIVYPLLAPGYLLLLDLPFGPRPLPSTFWSLDGNPASLTPLWELLRLAYAVSPADEVVGKAFTIAVVIAIGLAAAPLGGETRLGRVFAVAMAMVNPWVYDRLFVGHVPLLAAYAAALYGFRAMLDLADRPTRGRVLRLAMASTVVGVFDPRLLYVFALICAAVGAWRIALPGDVPRRQLLVSGAAVGMIVAALSAYWLIPFLPGGSTLGRITEGDILAFATRRDPALGAVFNVAALYGFWRRVWLAKDALPFWWLLTDAIIALAVAGTFRLWRDPALRWMAGALTTTWLLALFIAVGVSSQYTAPLWRLAFELIPGFAGLREPQKAAAFIAIVYVFAGARGAAWLLEAVRGSSIARREQVAATLAVIVLALPLIAGWRTFGGAWGALSPTRYPDSWYQAAALIKEMNDRDDAVLFLPWHLYSAYDFTGQSVVSNPAPMFFPGRVISGDNSELEGLPNQSGNPRSNYIEAMLRRRNDITYAGNLLAPLDVRFVLLASAPDTEAYQFLRDSTDLQLLRRWDNLELYENTRPVSRFAAVDREIAVSDLDALITLGRTQSLSGVRIRVTPDAPLVHTVEQAEPVPVPYREDSAAPPRFQVGAAHGKYLLFADPFHPAWRLGDASAQPNAAATNAFPAPAREAAVTAAGGGLRVVSLAVSLGAATVLLAYATVSVLHERRTAVLRIDAQGDQNR